MAIFTYQKYRVTYEAPNQEMADQMLKNDIDWGNVTVNPDYVEPQAELPLVEDTAEKKQKPKEDQKEEIK